jgi:hypothetical protein
MIYLYSGSALMSSLMAFGEKKVLKTDFFWSERQEVTGVEEIAYA